MDFSGVRDFGVRFALPVVLALNNRRFRMPRGAVSESVISEGRARKPLAWEARSAVHPPNTGVRICVLFLGMNPLVQAALLDQE